MNAPLKLDDQIPALEAANMEYLISVIRTLGTRYFTVSLMSFLAEICKADHYAIFGITAVQPFHIIGVSRDGTDTAKRQSILYISGTYWKSDAMMQRAQQELDANVIWTDHMAIKKLPRGDFRSRIYSQTHVSERAVMFGGRQQPAFLLSILRTSHGVGDSSLNSEAFKRCAPILAPIIGKHLEINNSRLDASLALTSLDMIAETLATSALSLAAREREVCARVIYGMSTTGIALDLEIGEETVSTYRKRAYQRLGISSQRELVIWYLGLWGKRGLTAPCDPPSGPC